MRRVGLVFALFIVVATAGAALVAWSVPEATVRAVVAQQIRAATGLEPTIHGRARLSLLPVPGIRVGAVSLPGTAAWSFDADGIEAALRLMPLFAGRLELASLSLRHPRLTLTVPSDPAQPAMNLPRGLSVAALPGSLRLVGGRLVLRGAGGEEVIGIDEAAVSASAFGKGLQASGALSWRDQVINASASVADAKALLAGGRSDVRVKGVSDLGKLSLGGSWSPAEGRFEGSMTAKAPSLAAVLRWAGLPLGTSHAFEAVSLQSPVSVAPGSASLSAVELELDGNALEGALRLQGGAVRPRITGTLAGDLLDVTPYARDLVAAADTGRDWRAEPLQLGGLALADLDIRLSAAEARLAGIRLGHLAAAVATHDGAAELSLGDAAAYGGSVRGRLSLAPVVAGARFEADLAADAVDVGPALVDLLGARRLEGTGSGRLDVVATGASVNALMHDLQGQADMAVAGGALVGIDLPDALRRVQRRPLSATLDQSGGRTPFDGISGTFSIAEGVAHTTDSRLAGPAVGIDLRGRVDLGERRVDLAAVAALPEADGLAAFRLPFRMAGIWSRPTLSLDAESLIRQSGAAAPLLGSFDTVTATPSAVPTLTP